MNWRQQPKAELHCHLLEIIDPALLSHIQSNGGTVLAEPRALQAAYPVSNRARFNQWLALVKPYQAECFEAMRPVMTTHLSRLIAQNVVYAEIMLSPAMFPRQREAMLKAVHQWREWSLEQEQGKIQVEYLMVIPRTMDAALIEHDAQNLLELRRANLIVGVALVGMETGESLERFSRAFALCRTPVWALKFMPANTAARSSIHDALRFGRPDRLGHCLSAFRDPNLVELIRKTNVHIEFCPSSNLRTGAVSHLSQHSIQHALEHELSFSINTDNPGMFGCSVNSEQQMLAEMFGFSTDDFGNIFHNSLAARFESKLRYWDSSTVGPPKG